MIRSQHLIPVWLIWGQRSVRYWPFSRFKKNRTSESLYPRCRNLVVSYENKFVRQSRTDTCVQTIPQLVHVRFFIPFPELVGKVSKLGRENPWVRNVRFTMKVGGVLAMTQFGYAWCSIWMPPLLYLMERNIRFNKFND